MAEMMAVESEHGADGGRPRPARWRRHCVQILSQEEHSPIELFQSGEFPTLSVLDKTGRKHTRTNWRQRPSLSLTGRRLSY